MATITNYFEQAQLSMAAYALGLQPGMSGSDQDYIDKLKFAGMSQKQAEEFANTYAVVDQFTDSLTGFSGTVFADSSGNKYFAIRGSEASIIDWIGTNYGDIGADGIAISQGISMFNWLQRLIGANGNGVVQYSYNATTRTISTFTGTANGRLSGQTVPLAVAGHSLGGHLAMMLSRLAPTLIDEVHAYNAPGFDTTLRTNLFPLTSEGFFSLLQNAPIGPITGPIGTGWNPGIMAHLDVEGDFVHTIGNRPGISQIIYSESANQGIYDAHIIRPVVDSLALYNLFATLDPNLNATPATGVSKITDILKASASTEAKTLETTLADVITLFQRDYQNRSTVAFDLIGPTDDREDYYTKLFALEAYLKGTPLYNVSTQRFSLTIDSLTSKSTEALVAAAQSSDPATRYALYKLNAFTVSGAGLYEAINANNDLDLYDSNTRTGVLTEEYLEDRAAFLVSKMASGTANTQSNNRDWAKYSGLPQHFQDGTGPSAYHLYLGASSSVINQSTTTLSNIIFGEWFDNSGTSALVGGDRWDKLYGLDGDDTLEGKKGNDYLEGGRGNDTYIFNTGDGLDTLLDTDGLGKITFDGVDLNGGQKLFGDTYRSTDGNYLYTLLQNTTGQDLLISGMGGQIIVKDFQPGELGIALNGSTTPAPTSEFRGTANNDADLIDSGVPVGVAGGGVLDTNWQNYAAYGQVVYHDTDDVGGMFFLSRAGQPFPENTVFDALYGEGGDVVGPQLPRAASPRGSRRGPRDTDVAVAA